MQYEGSSLATKRFLTADERGSIVAVTDSAGNATSINKFDEYGNPQSSNAAISAGGRFQYTGQAWLPELGMYYYKARIYNPALGRFMQTDPIGYGDGLNMYNYVGGDPVNASDPSGLSAFGGTNIFVPGGPDRDPWDPPVDRLCFPGDMSCIREQGPGLGGSDSGDDIVVTGSRGNSGSGSSGGGSSGSFGPGDSNVERLRDTLGDIIIVNGAVGFRLDLSGGSGNGSGLDITNLDRLRGRLDDVIIVDGLRLRRPPVVIMPGGQVLPTTCAIAQAKGAWKGITQPSALAGHGMGVSVWLVKSSPEIIGKISGVVPRIYHLGKASVPGALLSAGIQGAQGAIEAAWSEKSC